MKARKLTAPTGEPVKVYQNYRGRGGTHRKGNPPGVHPWGQRSIEDNRRKRLREKRLREKREKADADDT